MIMIIQFIARKVGSQAGKIHAPNESKQDSTQESQAGQVILIESRCTCIQYASNGLHKDKLPQVNAANSIKLQL